MLLKDSCHTADGIVVDHPYKSGKWIDVTGGWHDASDYLQYVLTSTNEPTMDGTASLSYLLSSLEASKPEKTEIGRTVDKQGAIVRMNQAEKKI